MTEGSALLSGRLGSENQLGVPKQYTLPQASWSVGTGVHIPNPQPSSGLQEQLKALNPGLANIRTQQQPYDSTAYSSALQKQIAQASSSTNLPSAASSLAGQYGFPQLPAQATSRFQPPSAAANQAQLQALLAQLNQSRQQAPAYPAAQLSQQIPPSLQTQLAQARESSRPYNQTLNSLTTPSHLQNPLSTLQGGANRLGLPPVLQQNSSLTPAHYQALLRSLPNNSTSQLDQLLRSGPSPNPNQAAGLSGLPSSVLHPTAAEDPLQAYLSGMANPPRTYNYGNQTLPSALPGSHSAAASLQYQMRLNNSLAEQRPLPNSGRHASLPGGGGSMDFNSLQPSRSPRPQAYHSQLPQLDRGTEPGPADFKHLQELLAAGGKDLPVDLLLKLQREMLQRGPAEPVKTADSSNAELQRLLAGLGPSQPPLGHSQAPFGHSQQLHSLGQQASGQQPFGQGQLPRAASRDSNLGLGAAEAERDPILQLRKQLSTHGGGLGSNQSETLSREPSSKGPVETPFAQEAQHVPHGQSTFLDAFGRTSRQSNRPEPSTAADNLATALSNRSATPASLQPPPSAVQSRMQSLAPPSSDTEAKPRPSGWPENLVPQLQRDGSAAASMKVHTGAAAPDEAAPRSEPAGRDWGPFTGFGSASSGAPWSQPWGPAVANADQPKPSHSLTGQPPVGGLSSSFQAADKQQRVDNTDTDWQAQLASLQNASRAQTAQSLAGNPLGSDFFSRPANQQTWPGRSGSHLPVGSEAKQPASSLFADYEQPSSRQGADQEPMIPSWLQTTSQGSGVWGAPTQQQPQSAYPSSETQPIIVCIT